MLCINGISFSQGLQGIVVEKYYLTNAADGANALSEGAVTTLNTGSTVYRVYVDMASGYKFSQMFGNSAHNLLVNTTTNFFNDPGYGVALDPSTISILNVKKHTAMIDSYFTVAGVAAGKVGVLKSEDTDGSLGNTQNILANNAGGCFGLPINGSGAQDGFTASSGTTWVSPNALGLGNALAALNQTAGGSITINNGSIAALGGVVGATTSNMVLIGQFTTDGVFTFQLNVQLVNIATGVAENYVASAPTGSELTHPSLILIGNSAPTVSISAPANSSSFITGSTVNITATAADANGTVSQVEFFVDGASVGIDLTSPYAATYTAVAGTHTISAQAKDNDCAISTSTNVTITVANNQAPTVSVTAPSSTAAGSSITFAATAADTDGTVAQVEFFVNNTSVGVDNSSPFTMAYTPLIGNGQLVKAVATDNLGLTGTSLNVTMNVVGNNPPSVSITSPLSSAAFIAPAVVTIDATAVDNDGTIAQVEFFVNNVSVGIDVISPYSYAWTSTPGNKAIVAKATDNNGALTSSATLNLVIADPNALPYAVVNTTLNCDVPTVCIPLAVALASPIDNVKGFDVVLQYDNTKLIPTGNITVYNNLTTSSYVETAYSVNAPSGGTGSINISAYFNGNAPSAAEFQGTGNIFCVEFAKSSTFIGTDSALVSVSFLQESYITGVVSRSASSGKAYSIKNQSYVGNLKFWLDNSPIAFDNALPNNYLVTNIYGATGTTVNNPSTPVQTNMSGQFTHTLTNGLNLKIDRDIVNTNSVQLLVNAADAVLGKTLLLNSSSFVPSVFQVIALDVNLDGVVSAGDISQIKQRATLSIPEYQQAWNYTNAGVSNGQPSRDWVFVDQNSITSNAAYQISATFPSNDNVGYSKGKVPAVSALLPATVTNYSTCPEITEETFKGVMLGDVNGSYAAYAADGILKSTNGEITLDLENAIVEGTKISVPVLISAETEVNALDIAFNSNVDLTFSNVSVLNSGTDVESFVNPMDKTFRLSANKLDNFDLSSNVLFLTFESTNGTVSESDFTSTLGLLNGKPAQVNFKKSSLVINQAELVNIFPNPSNGSFSIVLKETAQVDILDLNGKCLYKVGTVNENTKQAINLENVSAGVYLVRVSNDHFSSTQRIVVNK